MFKNWNKRYDRVSWNNLKATWQYPACCTDSVIEPKTFISQTKDISISVVFLLVYIFWEMFKIEKPTHYVEGVVVTNYLYPSIPVLLAPFLDKKVYYTWCKRWGFYHTFYPLYVYVMLTITTPLYQSSSLKYLKRLVFVSTPQTYYSCVQFCWLQTYVSVLLCMCFTTH